jgi:membrane protease YdiL (CAAX protease family)
MTPPLFYGWLMLAFSAGQMATVAVEVEGKPQLWRTLAYVLFTVGPPLFMCWLRNNSPRVRARRASRRRTLRLLPALAALLAAGCDAPKATAPPPVAGPEPINRAR